MTPLNGADGLIYAVAQGTIIAGGISAEGEAARVVQGVPTAGVIPAGARVEREVPFDFSQVSYLRLALKHPDFTTAARIERAVNAELGRGRDHAGFRHGGARHRRHADALARPCPARIENILVEPETRARVVVDQRSGTIVMGADVRISRVAVAQGNLTLRVEEAPMVVQPNPFAEGRNGGGAAQQCEHRPRTAPALPRCGGGTSLSEVVAGLNALGVAPHDMIDILKSINAAGAAAGRFMRNS
jgi:flagellar P-ring protein precursor FlgI